MADDNPNVMQAQLGLMGGGGGSMAPFGMPTPMPMPPPMRHPADAARDAVQMTQTMAMNTMQSAQAVNFAAMGTPGGGFSGGFGGGGGGGGWGMGGFANQYRQNMIGIQQQQLNPWLAGSMASMMGQGGYQSGMMPSPIQMTQPSMGIYRPSAPMPMGQIPPMPPMPLFPTPFTPSMPSPMFSTAFDYNMQRGELRGIQHTAGALSLPGVAARGGAAAAGGWAGAGLGAHMGARFGAGGAAIGSALGGIAGMMGTDHFLGGGIQGLADQMNPFDRVARHTAQIRGMSQDFVIGGSGLSAGGRGLSIGASAHMGRQLNNLAADSGFQRQTGSQFSTQDLMKITQTSGQQGLLDMAQNPEQMVGQVKNVAKALTAFMKLAGEPDVTEALRQMGQMRQMGLSLGETIQATQQAKQFARMSGTSVRGVMEAGGLPGAMIFQQQGLSAGLGMQVGMGGLGMARQAVAGGTYTTQQLAMLGGVQGVAQNNMEMSAAMLKQPMMAAAMSGFSGGSFGLNAGNVRQLAGGGLGINQLANMGVNNMTAAVAQGGISAIGSFQMQQGELQDQLGRALGPEGLKMMSFQQIRKTRDFLGLKGAGGTFAGAKAMGMTDDQAKQATMEMSSPEFFQNMQRQISITKQEQRAEAYARRQESSPTLIDKAAADSPSIRELRSSFRGLGTGVGDVLEGGVAMLSQSGEEHAANKSGQTVVRRAKSLLAQSSLEARMINKITLKEMRDAGAFSPTSSRDDALFRGSDGRALGRSELVGDFRAAVMGGDAFDVKQTRMGEGGIGALLGGGHMETAARSQGFGLAGALFFGDADEMTSRRKNIQGGSEITSRGLRANAAERSSASGAIAKKLGVSSKVAGKITVDYANAVADAARKKRKLIGPHAVLTKSDYDEIAQKVGDKNNISSEKLADVKSDMETAGVRLGKSVAGIDADAVTGIDVVNKADLRGQIDDAVKRQEARADNAMGDGTLGADTFGDFFKGGLMQFTPAGAISALSERGDRTRKDEFMQKIFATDANPEVGRLAVLLAASNAEKKSGTEGAATAAFDKEAGRLSLTEEGRKLLDRASDTQASFGKDNDMAVRMGQGGDAVSARSWVQTQKGYHADKAAQIYKKGVASLADSSVLAGGADKVLASSDASGKGLKGTAARRLAKEYHAEGTSQKRKDELDEEFKKLAVGRGDTAEHSLMGGIMNEISDAAADAKSALIGDEAAAAAGDFPDAVSEFSKASRALLEAASALTGMRPATNFDDGGSW